MKFVLLGAMFCWLGFLALWLSSMVLFYGLDRRRQRLHANRPVRAFKEGQRASKAPYHWGGENYDHRPAVFDVDAFLTEAEMEALEVVAKEEDEQEYFEYLGLFAVELANPALVESALVGLLKAADLAQLPDEEIARMRDEWAA